MSHWKRNSLLGIALVAIGIQFVPVSRMNPPVTQEVQASPEVRAVLKRSCFDCHSNEVDWPWYSKVAPVSWLTAHDVNEARDHLNFSEWDTYDAQQKRHIMEEIWNEIKDDDMPLKIYTLMHSDSLLSAADKELIHRWTEGMVNSALTEAEAHRQ